MSTEYLRASEIIPLYRLLKISEEVLDEELFALLDRIERRLFAALSIEEVESIAALDAAAVEELSKRL